MQRAGLVLGLILIGCAMNGCGGSSSGSTGSPSAGKPLDEYSGTLPDGSAMEIEILADGKGDWEGEFAVAADTGPYAFQTGTFFGSADEGNLSGTCQCTDGTQFTISGKVLDNGALQLTRSDIPGIKLTFTKVAIPAAASRADVSFKINSAGETFPATATLSTTPASTHSAVVEYRGTWLGTPITVWAYTKNLCVLMARPQDSVLGDYSFSPFLFSDFGTKTATSLVSSSSLLVSGFKNGTMNGASQRFFGTITVSP